MLEFAYNKSKNASTSHTLFELNCGYHPRVSFEDKCNLCSRSSSANGLAIKLRKLINIYCQNLFYTQNFKKQAHYKRVKPCSYALGEKVWLNSKHIKTKRNQKLEAKFFGSFRVFHLVGKQVYKLKLLVRWKIYNVFYLLLLNQDTIRKKRINKLTEFDVDDDKEYEVKAIYDSAVYVKEVDRHLPGLYYLVAYKSYPEEKNTWELFLAVIHLRKIVSTFHKDHLEKPTVKSLPLDSTPPMDRPTVKPIKPFKQKQGQLVKKRVTKRIK